MSSTDPALPPSSATDITRPPSASETALGTIGPYRLLEKIGEGGMGEVWLAEQSHPIRRQVALKVIKAGMDTKQVVARFEAERQALAVMDHPNIAKVFDAGSTPEGRPFFVMEYVRGEPITDYCDRVKMPLGKRLEVFASLCDGVQHAHQKGIIHRDLKPSNIVVSEIGDRPVPRVIDFGIAKATAHRLTDAPMHTEVGSFIGTPEYMSPEQADMTLDVDTRSDVYSLGIILFQLITGTLPFDTDALRSGSAENVRRFIREKEPPRPSARLRDVKIDVGRIAARRGLTHGRLISSLLGELDWVVLKALDKDRTRRYSTANALAADVRRYLQQEPVVARPPSASYRAVKFFQRNRIAVTASALVLVALLLFVGTLAVQTRRLADERDRANQQALIATRITEFLISLFRVSDPNEARGNTLTAREVLDAGARQIADNLRESPAVRASLLESIGTVYVNLGMYSAAEPLLEQAVAALRSSFGSRDPRTLRAIHHLADVFFYRQLPERAEPLYQEVLQTRTATIGTDHPDTIKAQIDLASLYVQEKRLVDAEPLVRSALELSKKVSGSSHDNTTVALNVLQNIYFQQQRYDDARLLAEEALSSSVSTHGEAHPSTLTDMHNLAVVIARQGNLQEAESLHLRTLAIKRNVLGPSHPATLNTVHALATVQLKLRKCDDVEQHLVSGYRDATGAMNQESKSLAGRLANLLVDAYTACGKPQLANAWKAKIPVAQ